MAKLTFYYVWLPPARMTSILQILPAHCLEAKAEGDFDIAADDGLIAEPAPKN